MSIPAVAVVGACALGLTSVLACGQSGAPQGSVNQALGNIAKGVAAQAWSGTVTITQSASNAFSKDDHVMHTSSGTQKASNSVVITLTKGIASSTIRFELRDNTDQLDHYDGYDLFGNVKEHTVATGTNNKDASVKISIYDDGRYEVEYSSGGVAGQWDKVETSRTQCAPGNSNCQNTSSRNTETAKLTNQGFVSGSVNGMVNKAQPNALTGTTVEPFDIFSSSTTPGKTTITWNLTR